MLTREKSKCSTVVGLCLAVLLAAGCGGGKSNSSSAGSGGSAATATTGSSNAGRAQACAFAREANTVYKSDSAALGLNFKDKAGEAKLIAAIGQVRSRIQSLAQTTSATETSQLSAYAAALGQQEAVVTAIRNNDFKTAAAHAQGLNQALEAGAASLSRICAGA